MFTSHLSLTVARLAPEVNLAIHRPVIFALRLVELNTCPNTCSELRGPAESEFAKKKKKSNEITWKISRCLGFSSQHQLKKISQKVRNSGTKS
jgi:hypothetical protein